MHWLSIDVALGAMCSSAMACALLDIKSLPWLSIGVLGASVLLIYTVDHLCDLRHIPVELMTTRRLFHWKHKHQLQVLAGILAASIGLCCLLFLPIRILYFGIVLGILVAMYLLLVNYLHPAKGTRWFHKEICIALVYTSGVWGISFMEATYISRMHYLLAFAFGLVVLLNLLLFSYFELDEDIQQQQRSIAKTWGKALTRKIIELLFLVFIALSLLLIFMHPEKLVQQALFAFCGMAAVLGLLFCFPVPFKRNSWYRLLGDAIFFIPGLVFLNQILFP